MMMLAEPAVARERSHHHRHVWKSKHSLHHSHHSWRTSSRHWRHRGVAVAWQQPFAAVQPVSETSAWQWQADAVPVVRQRRTRQRVVMVQPAVAAPIVWQQPVQQPVAAVVPFQWDVQQPVVRQRARVAAVETGGAYSSLVSSHAQANGLPVSLVHRVIMRESRYNPRAISKGNYGIMQIRLGTARAMGYTGSAAGLLDPNTNMTYAVRYLAGAYRAAGGNHSRAASLYASGYYYHAKRQGFSPYATAQATNP
jgi:soluble lytic murein transglycosylase-like protein